MKRFVKRIGTNHSNEGTTSPPTGHNLLETGGRREHLRAPALRAPLPRTRFDRVADITLLKDRQATSRGSSSRSGCSGARSVRGMWVGPSWSQSRCTAHCAARSSPPSRHGTGGGGEGIGYAFAGADRYATRADRGITVVALRVCALPEPTRRSSRLQAPMTRRVVL